MSDAYRGARSIEWSVLIRHFAGKCLVCGATKELVAHHIKSWKKHPKLRYDLSNGVCLCKHCHREIHRPDGLIRIETTRAGRIVLTVWKYEDGKYSFYDICPCPDCAERRGK
jgi:hypothetical protein